MMKINTHPMSREVRRFGLMWAAAASLVAGLLFLRHHASVAWGLWSLAIVVGAASVIRPSVGRYFHRGWMNLAYVINFLLTRITLSLLFWIVLTPVAILFKIIGRDALRLKRSASADSYWREHDKIPDPAYYRHLF
jgi:hypothetical protein